MKKFALISTIILVLISTTQAHALILINEFLADPPPGASGDVNQDGIASSVRDEFIELLNYSDYPTDLSGWKLRDALQLRHIFNTGTTLFPYRFLVVFGGGNPLLPGINWQTASTGTLSLNNAGDTISLLDENSQIVSQVIYGSIGNHDQSVVRNPDGTGTEFILHSQATGAGGRLFSPGVTVDGKNKAAAAVPEPLTLVTFALGSIYCIKKKRF